MMSLQRLNVLLASLFDDLSGTIQYIEAACMESIYQRAFLNISLCLMISLSGTIQYIEAACMESIYQTFSFLNIFSSEQFTTVNSM